MRFIPTAIPDVVIVESHVHRDERGYFAESFRSDRFSEAGLPVHFEQDNQSRSGPWVLRGLHYQLSRPQGKLVRVVSGSVYDVAVDLRRASPTFSQWVGVTLHAEDCRQLYIPPGFAHGYLTLGTTADIAYKCTTLYDRATDSVIRFDDPEIGIEWPMPQEAEVVISAKDRGAPTLANARVFD